MFEKAFVTALAEEIAAKIIPQIEHRNGSAEDYDTAAHRQRGCGVHRPHRAGGPAPDSQTGTRRRPKRPARPSGPVRSGPLDRSTQNLEAATRSPEPRKLMQVIPSRRPRAPFFAASVPWRT